MLTRSFAKFWGHYFRSRRFPDSQEFYVVYTSLDHAIPFQPDVAKQYWLVNFRFVPTTVKLRDVLSDESFNDIRDAYVDASRQAAAAFREVPTIMPHFTEHNQRALHAAQSLLKPINCCPSLHTATPLFFYNVGAKYFPEKEPQLRQYVGDVVSTVIKTKLHAMVDIAFGIFLSKKATNHKLGLDFRDLESFFTQEQRSRDNIPYDRIYRMYHDIEELARPRDGKEVDLARVMERYFQEMGLPRVRRQQSACFYDLEQKKLVHFPELKVGKGLL